MKKIKFSLVIETLNNNGFTLLDDESKYKDCFSCLSFIDGDGYKYFQSFDAIRKNIKSGGFPSKFGTKNKFSIYNISLWIKKNKKTFIILDGEYKTPHEKSITLKCLCCGNIWKTCSNIIFNNGECPSIECKRNRAEVRGRRKRLSPDNNFERRNPNLIEEWHNSNKFKPCEITPMSDYRATWKCRKCNHVWKTQVKNRTLGTGCPKCNKSNGEGRIERFLIDNSIEFFREFRYSGCKNIKPLPFDFKLKDRNIVIEFNGLQHYQSIPFWGGDSSFEYRKENDKIKKKYCKENEIEIIVIPYNKINRIEDILYRKLLK